MPEKPSYLGLLNAVALGESRAHCYLTAWIGVTKNPAVKGVLQTVAAREGEHGMAFAKRINELGYTVLDRPDANFDKQMAIASADCSDLEKMEKLGLGRLDTGDKPDLFDGFFKDHSIDIRTGELLGRYIAEERDTGRQLRCCYEALKADAGSHSSSDGATSRGAATAIATLDAKVDALCEAVAELRRLVDPSLVAASNGKGVPEKGVRAKR